MRYNPGKGEGVFFIKISTINLILRARVSDTQ